MQALYETLQLTLITFSPLGISYLHLVSKYHWLKCSRYIKDLRMHLPIQGIFLKRLSVSNT